MLASLVLHILLLYALPFLKETRWRMPAKLTAHLAPKPPEPIPPRLEPPPPQARPVAHPPIQRATPAVKALPQPAPVSAPILSAEPAKQASEPAFVVPATPPTAAPAASAPVARLDPQPEGAGPDAGAVARLRVELLEVMKRYKRYPRIARDNNWVGMVDLRVTIGADGAISSLSVKKGTGHAALDDEAQAMFRTAKSRVTIPPALLGKAFTMEISVNFLLTDEQQ